MTAPSESFLEDLMDYVVEIIGDKNIHIEIPDDWSDIWSRIDFPEYGEARLLDEDDNPVGVVKWETEYVIEDGVGGKYVGAYPKITYIEYKGNVHLDKRCEKTIDVRLTREELNVLINAIMHLKKNEGEKYSELLWKLRRVLNDIDCVKNTLSKPKGR